MEIAASGRAVRTGKSEGFKAGLAPAIAQIRAGGATSLRAIAAELNAREIETPKGGAWSAVQVQRVLADA